MSESIKSTLDSSNDFFSLNNLIFENESNENGQKLVFYNQ